MPTCHNFSHDIIKISKNTVCVIFSTITQEHKKWLWPYFICGRCPPWLFRSTLPGWRCLWIIHVLDLQQHPYQFCWYWALGDCRCAMWWSSVSFLCKNSFQMKTPCEDMVCQLKHAWCVEPYNKVVVLVFISFLLQPHWFLASFFFPAWGNQQHPLWLHFN